MTGYIIADDHRTTYHSHSMRRGSSFAIKALSEPTGASQSRRIGFRVSQSRSNRNRNAAAVTAALIQASYE